jgi:hypothetical protein
MNQKAASPDCAPAARRSCGPASAETVMNDSTRVPRRPRRAGPRPARTAAAIIATAALALLAAACSNPSSTGGAPNAGGSAPSTSAVAYSHCIRSHGVPHFPDPPSSGQVPKGDAQQFGVSSSQLQTARAVCQHLYPGNGGSFQQSIQQCELTGDCPQAVVQQALTEMRNYARCIRSHGVPNWPDPTTDSRGRPYFDVNRAGISHAYTHSPLFESKDRICERQIGGSAGVPVPLG